MAPKSTPPKSGTQEPSTPLPKVPPPQPNAGSPLTPAIHEARVSADVYASRLYIVLDRQSWSTSVQLALSSTLRDPRNESLLYGLFCEFFSPWARTIQNTEAHPILNPQYRINLSFSENPALQHLIPDFAIIKGLNNAPLILVEMKGLDIDPIPFNGFRDATARIAYQEAACRATGNAMAQVCAQAFCMFAHRPDIPTVYVMTLVHLRWSLFQFFQTQTPQETTRAPHSSASTTSQSNRSRLPEYGAAIKRLKEGLAATITSMLKPTILYFCEELMTWSKPEVPGDLTALKDIIPTQRLNKALSLILELSADALGVPNAMLHDAQPSWYDVTDEDAARPDERLRRLGMDTYDAKYSELEDTFQEPLEALLEPDDLDDAMEEIDLRDGTYEPSKADAQRAITRLRGRIVTRLQATTPTKEVRKLPELPELPRIRTSVVKDFVPTSPTSPTPTGPRKGASNRPGGAAPALEQRRPGDT